MRRSSFLLWALAAPVSAATFTVTNTDDSGAGSLREAILNANGNPGLDTIAFNIPGAGVHTITPQTLLPTITDPALIDGYAQPGSSENTDPTATNAVLLIELDGTAIQGGDRTGLRISSSAPSTIQGLVVNRFSRGTRADGSGSHTIRGSFVGTDPTGTIPLENHDGVSIGGSGATLVGGLAPGDRNLLSGNSDGIETTNASALIQGNLVGTDPTGTLAIPNLWGIHVVTIGGAGVLIGGTAPGAGNIISGNTSRGIQLTQNPNNAVVQGNRIGTTADGSGPLGNNEGIVYELAGSQTTIGGVGPGEANEIAYNALRGVVVTGGAGSGNTIRGNSIHDNGGLGIDLRNDFAPNFNDSQDADNGPNGLQNYPLIQEVEHLGPQGAGSTRIAGRLHSEPSTSFDLDFYANPACSNFPREFIEGETYLGSTPVTTDGNGDASFDVTLPVRTESGARISATATDPDGNTSEFSQRIVFSMTPASGPANGGVLLAINGTDFEDPTIVLIGGAAPSSLVLLDDHRMTANAPALPPGLPTTSSSPRPTARRERSSRAGSPTSSTCPRDTSSTTSS